MASIRSRCVAVSRGVLAGTLLLLGEAAPALTPPSLRWEILPGPSPLGVPIASDEQAQGPIGGNASNTAHAGLTHNGITNVDYGLATAESTIVVDAGTLVGSPICSPAPCASSSAIWSDTATLRATGVADGMPGSLTARILRLGNLAAEVPADWVSYVGTLVQSDYGILVFVNGVLRDRVAPICVATPNDVCTRIGLTRSYYPEGSMTAETTPIGFDDPIPLGPYDFTFGQPFQLEVRVSAHTIVNKGGNATGTPQARSVVFASWGGLVEVHDAAGLGGNSIPLADVSASLASGRDWVRAPEPDPFGGAAAAAAALGARAVRARRARRTDRAREQVDAQQLVATAS